ncbi:MAG: hypothetical protein J6Y82_08230 [Bacteroidales bacterium]|nr:hypothetical protein [Bacteroidales bacterium]
MKLSKTIFTMIAAALAAACSHAPQTFSFSGVVRDSSNVLLRDTMIMINVGISQGETSETATSVYYELQQAFIGSNGVYTIEVGDGSDDGRNFSGISWTAAQNHFLTVETPYNTTTYVLLGDYYYLYVDNPEVTAIYEAEDAAGYSSPNADNGALRGTFSVAPDRKVRFSQGNLQYKASSGSWRFAENQYDRIGYENVNISADYNGWIDLFGWATSGYLSEPYLASETSADYGPGCDCDLTDYTANHDWGVFCAIGNGGNAAGLWRTPTRDEWVYLFNRTDEQGNIKFGVASVGEANGMVILPDDWTLPEGLTFNTGVHEGDEFKYNRYYAEMNYYSLYDWLMMEEAGAVFLPAVGWRHGTQFDFDNLGGYWSSTSYGEVGARGITFAPNMIRSNIYDERCSGMAVRLVRDE